MAKIKQTAVFELYQKDIQQWRTIENNWMEQAESIALYLNDLTNNSSLVLAFELVQSKKVLLFAGDAQTDNWRSWSDIKWPKEIPENKTEQLLANTVLYKVGHHGSHNGTYKPAFEKMRHPELVAMIPVDRTDPNIENTEYPWQMPAVNLYEDLKKQTNHKILRMDDIVIMEPPLDRAESNRENWKKWKDTIITNDLYVELNIR